jgi:hypothetical protein
MQMRRRRQVLVAGCGAENADVLAESVSTNVRELFCDI